MPCQKKCDGLVLIKGEEKSRGKGAKNGLHNASSGLQTASEEAESTCLTFPASHGPHLGHEVVAVSVLLCP